MNVIEFENVVKNVKKVPVLHGISFRLQTDSITGIIGPMDSGKSTALKLISGLEQPDSGRIRFYDDTTGLDVERPSMGLLINSPGTYPTLSVRDHFEIKARILGLKSENIDFLFDMFRIRNIQNLRMGNLTQQLRNTAGIALALMGDPQLVLLDEPFSGFRYQDIAFIQNALKQYRQEYHCTMIIASRSTEEIADFADAFVFLQEGSVVKADTKEDIITSLPGYIKLVADPLQDAKAVLDAHEIYSYQTKSDHVVHIFEKIDQAEEIRKMIEDAGVHVSECKVVQDAMEDYFGFGRKGGLR
ncbi:MAG: ABC transporter ATP-binding protein [Lachnospiraceae bacterium]|nr:ABC transporter ATP-binding protein [Lachnospiraceae bacterium]